MAKILLGEVLSFFSIAKEYLLDMTLMMFNFQQKQNYQSDNFYINLVENNQAGDFAFDVYSKSYEDKLLLRQYCFIADETRFGDYQPHETNLVLNRGAKEIYVANMRIDIDIFYLKKKLDDEIILPHLLLENRKPLLREDSGYIMLECNLSKFDFINKPLITYPANLSIVDDSVYFTSSPFVADSSKIQHSSSNWQLATDNNFFNIIKETVKSRVYKTYWTANGLLTNTNYYLRVSYVGKDVIQSGWSDKVKFTVS